MEVSQAILALHFVDPELDFSERMILILLQISQRNLEYSSLQGVVCVFKTGGPVDERFADTTDLSFLFGRTRSAVRTRELGK